MSSVLAEIVLERNRQDAKWGEQNHPDGTGPDAMVAGLWLGGWAPIMRKATQRAATEGWLTWLHVLAEEFAEAAEADSKANLRAELIQVAAVAIAWIEAIDRRSP